MFSSAEQMARIRQKLPPSLGSPGDYGHNERREVEKYPSAKRDLLGEFVVHVQP